MYHTKIYFHFVIDLLNILFSYNIFSVNKISCLENNCTSTCKYFDLINILNIAFFFFVYLQGLQNDLNTREAQFNVVQDKGESLVRNRHPAAKTIEVRSTIICLLSLLLYSLKIFYQDMLKQALE